MDNGRFCVLSAYDMSGLPLDGDIHRDVDDDRSVSSRDPTLCSRACSSFSRLTHWEVWKAVLMGQVLSGLLCATGVTSQLLQSAHALHIPTAQSFVNYVLLCSVFTTWLACRGGNAGLIPVLRARGLRYFMIAVVDVEANYLVVKAYQYTTLTSIQLLDCFTIPTVLALSWLALKVRYKLVHVLGVSVALLGVGCLVWADAHDAADAPNRLLGDMLCLAGAALYGVSNVAQEASVKLCGTVEFLGVLGLFGSVVNGIQLALLEKEQVGEIRWDNWQEVSLLLGFSLSLFMMYLLMPVVMRMSSATAVNLSILSADFYALLIGVYVFQYKFHWLYLVSFGLVLTGVALYLAKPTPLGLRRSQESDGTSSCGGAVNGAHYGPLPVVAADGTGPLLSVSHAVSVHAFAESSPKPNGATINAS